MGEEHFAEADKIVATHNCSDYWGCAGCPHIETCEAFAEAEDD
jgi:hypothetical protein